MLPEQPATPPPSPSAPPIYPVEGTQNGLPPWLTELLIIVGMGLVSAGLAQRKGYNPFAWVFAGGAIGWLFLAILPPVNAGGLGDQETVQARNRGNLLGIGLSAFSAFIGLALWILLQGK